MARINLKVAGSPKVANLVDGDTIDAENILELTRRQRLLDNYEYDYFVFVNGIRTNDELKGLQNGDEVVLVPIATGG